MPIKAKFLFFASMDVAPEKDALFNEVYDQEHVPMLPKVPGVISVVRLETQPLTLSIGGERKPSLPRGSRNIPRSMKSKVPRFW